MPLDNAALQTMGNALAADLTHLRVHSADPGTGETSALGSARVACAFTSDADGDLTLDAPVQLTGLAASTAVAYVTLWDASSAGTRQGKFAVTGDSATNAAGEYRIDSLPITGTAS